MFLVKGLVKCIVSKANSHHVEGPGSVREELDQTVRITVLYRNLKKKQSSQGILTLSRWWSSTDYKVERVRIGEEDNRKVSFLVGENKGVSSRGD